MATADERFRRKQTGAHLSFVSSSSVAPEKRSQKEKMVRRVPSRCQWLPFVKIGDNSLTRRGRPSCVLRSNQERKEAFIREGQPIRELRSYRAQSSIRLHESI